MNLQAGVAEMTVERIRDQVAGQEERGSPSAFRGARFYRLGSDHFGSKVDVGPGRDEARSFCPRSRDSFHFVSTS